MKIKQALTDCPDQKGQSAQAKSRKQLDQQLAEAVHTQAEATNRSGLEPSKADERSQDDKTPEGKRQYHSPLREKQAAQTRELILEQAMKVLAASSGDEILLAEVARQAGISERTLYRYFATREELLEGLSQWLDRRIV